VIRLIGKLANARQGPSKDSRESGFFAVEEDHNRNRREDAGDCGSYWGVVRGVLRQRSKSFGSRRGKGNAVSQSIGMNRYLRRGSSSLGSNSSRQLGRQLPTALHFR
jgi:hypothetical protein